MHRFMAYLLLIPLTATARPGAPGGHLATPLVTTGGIICTNSYGSALYRVRDGSCEELLAGPGAGAFISVSPEGDRVGFKEILPDGRQCAAILDPMTGVAHRLTPPVARVGQVSFAAGGITAYTVGTDLVVVQDGRHDAYDLGTYANLAPLSPGGGHVVFNDTDDQLWILELATGMRTRITSGPKGHTGPVWSPDGNRLVFSSLDGFLAVHDRISKRTYPLGEGLHPVWSPDGRFVYFDRPVVEHDSLVRCELHRVHPDGSNTTRMNTGDWTVAMEPRVTADGAGILFHTGNSREIILAGTGTGAPIPAAAPVRVASAAGLVIRPLFPQETPHAPAALDVPYVHQVYDTPDWFNGHWACAPTQAIMVMAYHNVLPPWEITCTWPSRHVTPWGNYVASPYRFRGNTFTSAAADPNGVNGMGGYGYMWTGSYSPHSRMADYYRSHGLVATQTEGTPYSVAADEIAAGHPFSMCVLLTTSGHLVLAHGFGNEPHTLVFNDPYGNKNTGYMNAAGKNVRYDWPGYNNGYQNLQLVAWCIATRYTPPAVSDTLVDDLHFGRGFTMATAPPASMSAWKDLTRGHDGHLWYALTTTGAVDTFHVEWRPSLSAGGSYAVQAFIELSNATDARYVVTHAGGRDTVRIDQKRYSKAWASLGTYTFEAGNAGSVRLGNTSGTAGQEIVFDAVRWVRTQPTSAGGPLPSHTFRLEQNVPNPFNPSTTLRFTLPSAAEITLEVLNSLGQRVALLQSGAMQQGEHTMLWTPAGSASGVYFARLRAAFHGGRSEHAVIRMLLVR